MANPKPILYSFRRCPYAIRARLALYYSGIVCELREVVLKSKPPALLSVSPKATVPVLVFEDNTLNRTEQNVIEQSIEIIDWALNQSDPSNWLVHGYDHSLIVRCDNEFKHWLDRYKYADRFPEHIPEYYFQQACQFLQEIENMFVPTSDFVQPINDRGKEHRLCFICSPNVSILDIAIFPFVRQFAFVDKAAFDALELPKLQMWLDYFLGSALFLSVMEKYPMWVEGESQSTLFGQTKKERS